MKSEKNESVNDLWRLLVDRMVRVDKEYRSLVQKREMFKLRRRMNPHHHPDQVHAEREDLVRHISEMTISLKQDFQDIKRDYLEHRDEFRMMAKGDEVKYVEAMERVLDDDFEKEFFHE